MLAERVIVWLVTGLRASAALTLFFGMWSALRPERSIELYQAIMRAFNWRVEPIDHRRELITTRCLGVVLTCCSILSVFLLW